MLTGFSKTVLTSGPLLGEGHGVLLQFFLNSLLNGGSQLGSMPSYAVNPAKGGKGMSNFAKRARKGAATVVSASIFLSACVTTQVDRIGADDGTDVCRANLVALDATGDYFAEDMMKGALIGALAGGLLGAVASKDRAKGAAIGAAAGAAAGAAGGYFTSKMQQEKDKAVLYQTVLSDYEKELAKIDEADLAFKKLQECRDTAMRQVVADYKAKLIGRDEAKLRWRRLVDQKAKDLRVAEAMGKNMANRIGEFENASKQLQEMPWDEKQEAQLKLQTAELEAKHAAEAAELERQQKAALKAKKKKEAAEYEQRMKQQKASHEASLAALQAKKAGAVPTMTAQTRIQSYNANVQTASAEQHKQAAVADNPDGFESALPPAKKAEVPQGTEQHAQAAITARL